jgi:lipoprotein NlpI
MNESSTGAPKKGNLFLSFLNIIMEVHQRLAKWCKPRKIGIAVYRTLTLGLILLTHLLNAGSGTGYCIQNQDSTTAFQKANEALASGDNASAIKWLSEAISKEPNDIGLLQLRAETYFRSGDYKNSIPDFDKVVELKPAFKAENWQRGIALYYVGRFKDGAEQFEEHHRVNPDDVENTFWYFLCLAKQESIEAARKKIIPSRGDARAPLMEIYKLVRGEISPADVEKAVAQFPANSPQRTQAEFYGFLYLGLWYDLAGDKPKAIDFLKKSLAANSRGYMADVAKVHLQTLQPSKTK